jgi:hypothetical protein
MSRQERDSTGRIIPPTDRPDVVSPNGPDVMTPNRPDIVTPTGRVTEAERRATVEGPVTWEEVRALLRREPTVYERTWRPTVGGLLSILAGSWNFLLGIGAVLGGTIFADLIPTFTGTTGGFDVTTTGAGGFLILIGLISIIGGSYALARRGWPMALAGSIVALVPTPLILPFIMGILSLIFNVLGHKEFWGPRQFQKDYQSNLQHNIEKSEPVNR